MPSKLKHNVIFFFSYPGSDPLNVSQSGQPLGSIRVRRVGSILMDQRGHLQGGKARWRLCVWADLRRKAGEASRWRAEPSVWRGGEGSGPTRFLLLSCPPNLQGLKRRSERRMRKKESQNEKKWRWRLYLCGTGESRDCIRSPAV